jgi:DNA-binding transcriptional ArsR family regulator
MEKQIVLAALAALAQETRLDVFRMLVRSGDDGLAPGQMAAALNLPAATLSFHLKELKGAGLLCCSRDGRSRIYRPDFDTIGSLLAYLSENCCASRAEK